MGLFSRRSSEADGESLRIFFASDVHGSEKCWKKFLAAGEVHRVDILVMGGDLSAKAIIPFVRDGAGYTATVGGRTERLQTEEERRTFAAILRDQGFYTTTMEPGTVLGEEESDRLYESLARETLERWLGLAEQKLAGTPRRLLLMPGNDDLRSLDELIVESDWLVNPDERLLEVGRGYSLAAVGTANPTPWSTPRELEEDDLEALLERTIDGADGDRLVLVSHVPPYDTTLDGAPKLIEDDGELARDTRGGQPIMVPVGSTAVRAVIERHQPLIGLHGHVHEARGVVDLGRTVCVNPGSEFTSGDVSGAIVELRGTAVRQCQLITA